MLGATMLEAPVSGSIPQAETGTLEIVVGGDREAFATALPLLRELGQTVTYIGPSGHAVILKLAINVSLAVQTLAFSEGLLLAERDGIDPELAATVMGASPIGSPMLNARMRLLLAPPQDAWFDIELMHKDIRLARQAADESGTRCRRRGSRTNPEPRERARVRTPRRCRSARRSPPDYERD
jgi:3-hydroxyisobutyrate dehydrogenase-like beta-hydroxyacid dehydrogenase